MMLSVLVVCVAVASVAPVNGQYRPSYFPRPGGFDKTLPQYNSENGDAAIGNRNQRPDLPAPGMANSLDDTQLANRVQEWPRPNQPFWHLNQQAIQQHTAQQVPCAGPGCPAAPIGAAPQSSFIGGNARGRR